MTREHRAQFNAKIKDRNSGQPSNFPAWLMPPIQPVQPIGRVIDLMDPITPEEERRNAARQRNV